VIVSELQDIVARSSDSADLHGTVPALLIEAQTAFGALAATVSAATERGRRPFRPTPEWASRLGEVVYGMYLLADQSGVDLDEVVRLTSRHIEARGAQAKAADDNSWPFETR
jgi:hypothetical protein